jgi:hypothetical protein
MSDETGKGAEILILDTLGNLLNRINSPAQYPMGLAYHQGLIYSSERDGEQRIFRFYPDNDFHYEIIGNNPIREQFAPRCFTFYNDLFHQVNTFFSSNVLTNSEISVFNLQTSEILSKVPLVEQTGKMNARGIDIDSKDNNYWVSNFTGTLFKISTRNLSTNIEDINTNSALTIFPNPASNYISFGISGENNGISSISIINSIGEEVINDKINNSELKEFDISKLPTGVYFVILNSNYKNPIYQRFIKY